MKGKKTRNISILVIRINKLYIMTTTTEKKTSNDKDRKMKKKNENSYIKSNSLGSQHNTAMRQ